MAEIRNAYEGTLRWCRASGTGNAWATAASVTGTGGDETGDWGTLGYVTDMTYTSAQTVETISERGIPSHHKVTQKSHIQVSFTLQWGVTGDYPDMNVTGSGASVPMVLLELKSTAPEAGAAIYHQMHGVPLESLNFTEANPANTQAYTMRSLAMVGPTASGYLG